MAVKKTGNICVMRVMHPEYTRPCTKEWFDIFNETFICTFVRLVHICPCTIQLERGRCLFFHVIWRRLEWEVLVFQKANNTSLNF